MSPRSKLSNERFGRLVAVEYLGKSLWLCRCDCGQEIRATTRNIKSGNTRSCGCLHRERNGDTHRTHGMSQTLTYAVWLSMRARCKNESLSSYRNYGGRGIKVCDRWASSFEAFLSDMGEAQDGKSLDRIDVDGDYSPENCRWADAVTQQNNKRNSVFIEFDGERMTVAQWSRRLGVPAGTIRTRIALGMSSENILTTKKHGDALSVEDVERAAKNFANPNRLTGLTRVAAEYGVSSDTLRKRLRRHFAGEASA